MLRRLLNAFKGANRVKQTDHDHVNTMTIAELANYRPVTAALTFEQHNRLKRLSKKTRVPMQEYLREAVDMLLRKYERKRTP